MEEADLSESQAASHLISRTLKSKTNPVNLYALWSSLCLSFTYLILMVVLIGESWEDAKIRGAEISVHNPGGAVLDPRRRDVKLFSSIL